MVEVYRELTKSVIFFSVFIKRRKFFLNCYVAACSIEKLKNSYLRPVLRQIFSPRSLARSDVSDYMSSSYSFCWALPSSPMSSTRTEEVQFYIYWAMLLFSASELPTLGKFITQMKLVNFGYLGSTTTT